QPTPTRPAQRSCIRYPSRRNSASTNRRRMPGARCMDQPREEVERARSRRAEAEYSDCVQRGVGEEGYGKGGGCDKGGCEQGCWEEAV
ncbi:hypothetical protein FRC08_005002, partial [Ceratobasidium sp. 394]